VLTGTVTGAMYLYSASVTNTTIATAFASNHAANVQQVLQINSNQIATASFDNTIKIWNIDSRTLVNTYYIHTDQVWALVILPGGLLASGGADATVRVWNMQTQTVNTINVVDKVTSLLLNPTVSTNALLVVLMANFISYYDSITLSPFQTITTNRIYNGVDLLPTSGNIIAYNEYLDIYNTTGSLIFSIYFLGFTATRIKVMPDNLTVVCGTSNGSLVLFNVNSNTFGSIYQVANTSSISILSTTPDNLYLVSWGSGQICFWKWSAISLTLVNLLTDVGPLGTRTFIQPSFSGICIIFLNSGWTFMVFLT
jgi:WD40 repeat protein